MSKFRQRMDDLCGELGDSAGILICDPKTRPAYFIMNVAWSDMYDALKWRHMNDKLLRQQVVELQEWAYDGMGWPGTMESFTFVLIYVRLTQFLEGDK